MTSLDVAKIFQCLKNKKQLVITGVYVQTFPSHTVSKCLERETLADLLESELAGSSFQMTEAPI